MQRDELLLAIYGTNKSKKIEEAFVVDARRAKTIESILKLVNKYTLFAFYDSAFSTINARVKKLRDIGTKVNPRLHNLFETPSEAFKLAIDKRKKTQHEKELTNSTPRNFADLAKRLISEMIENIENKNVETRSNNSKIERELAYLKLIVLGVATGRRQIELLKMVSVNKKLDKALYSGLAKKINGEDKVIAPILCDVKIVQKYLREVREVFKTEDMENKAINSKYNAIIGKALKRYLPDYVKEKNFHHLRKIYAQACFELFGEGTNEAHYVAEVLGHSLPNLASDSYSKRS